jgi:hypothetical protein
MRGIFRSPILRNVTRFDATTRSERDNDRPDSARRAPVALHRARNRPSHDGATMIATLFRHGTLLAVFATLATSLALPSDAHAAPGWVEAQQLVAGNGTAGDKFGWSLALDGDTAFVATYLAPVGGNASQGAVYVFTRNEAGEWVPDDILTASDGAPHDWFGYSVALRGDTAIIGATGVYVGSHDDQGAAYVFTRNEAGEWAETARLTAEGGIAGEWFGFSVAVEGDTAIIGTPEADVGGDSFQGKVYVFDRVGDTWSEGQTLTASDGEAFDQLGYSVALQGTTIVAAAPEVAVDGRSGQGAAYVFTKSGGTWGFAERLVANDGAAYDDFGRSVAIEGTDLWIGADKANIDAHADQGAAYRFEEVGGSWSQAGKLFATDGQPNDLFGSSIAVDGDTALVGAREATVGDNSGQGAAWLFTRGANGWDGGRRLVATDGATNARFGVRVALDGGTALVGAYYANVGANFQQGAAYVYRNDTVFANGFE